MFFPETGTPIWKMDRMSTRFAVWLPEPLTVATWMLKSLMTRRERDGPVAVSWTATFGSDMGPRGQKLRIDATQLIIAGPCGWILPGARDWGLGSARWRCRNHQRRA